MTQNSLVGENLLKQRSCSDCTKCCEGSLSGEVFGKTFYSGKPCHFVKLNEGCSVYKINGLVETLIKEKVEASKKPLPKNILPVNSKS